MSKELQLTEEAYNALEAEGKKDGLTVDQEAELACLIFFYKNDRDFFETVAKQKADPKVLHVFERKYA